MRRTFQTGGVALAIAMIAVATPVAAQDQGNDHGDHGGRQERHGEEGRGPPPAEQRPAPAAQPRADAQSAPMRAPRQAPVQYQAQSTQQRNWQQGQGGYNRGNPDPANRYRGQPSNLPNQANRYQDNRDSGGRDQYRGGDRSQWQGDRGRPDQAGRDQSYRGRDDGRYGRQDDRGPNGYDRGPGREQWRGDQARGGYGRDDHRDWNRGWHDDQRYDWNGYRARNRDAYRLGGYYAPYRGYSYRRISIGFSLQPLFFGSSYWIGDPYQYRLPPAYGPYRWVRYYDDALLVNIYTGEVVDTVYDIFW